MSKENPFSELVATQPTSTSSNSNSLLNSSQINVLDQKVNTLIEQIFMITVKKTPPKSRQFIYMEEIAPLVGNTELLNIGILEQALFERLLLPTPSDFLIPNDCKTDDHDNVIESRVMAYLYGAYVRMENCKNPSDTIVQNTCKTIEELILRNVCTAMKQPDLFEGQKFSNQLLDIFQTAEDFDKKGKFLSAIVKEMLNENDDTEDAATKAQNKLSLKQVIYPILLQIAMKCQSASMITLEKWIIPVLMLFVCDKTNSKLAQLLLEYTTPPAGADGIKFADSIFGYLLRLSILPKNQNGPYEYYDNVLDAQSTALSQSLWNYLKIHLDSVSALFKGFLLFGGEIRNQMLKWIGTCLHSNAARGQIWNSHNPAAGTFSSMKTASDSFMIGLAGVLLRLCKPLLKPQLKVLFVDPTYCSVIEGDRQRKGVHMINMDKETCLLPSNEEDEQRCTAETYNFVTECFFMTHKAIDLGYRVCIEKFVQISREIHRLQTAYQDAVNQGATEVAQNFTQLLTTEMPQLLCLRNTIIEPFNDQLLLQFHEASAIWLCQLTAREISLSEKGYAPQTAENINLPIPVNQIPKLLKSIPEIILENIVGYLTFIRHFEGQNIDTDPDVQNALFTMILVFMGNSERVRNPHLRARLAEALESLLPKKNNATNSFRASWRSSLFTDHPHRLEIIPNLLRVFVGIEVTGQSVQFEQKFNYRRPMYIIMEYLWNIPEQQCCFKQLANEAVQNMEDVDPPIFLRFINLLINDAIYLLDESLSNLQQIRTLQHAQDNGDWSTLPTQERQQNLQNMQHLGMIARFDNILGRDTINILKLLTSEIDGIFCHASMVERVAAMLNYFLLHLVGPNKGNFKVKDKKEFEFDPANTVLEICRIYINLEKSNSFVLAVSQDGRSYSPKLFEYAEHVLVRIGGGQLIGEINDFAIKVRRLEKQEKENQEALVDAPDDYLDPIMSTLMLDPVILPSSKVTVDRTTIARHLLSDQSDPFNRSPLTMDQIINNVELKQKIDEWIQEKKALYNSNKSASSASSPPSSTSSTNTTDKDVL